MVTVRGTWRLGIVGSFVLAACGSAVATAPPSREPPLPSAEGAPAATRTTAPVATPAPTSSGAFTARLPVQDCCRSLALPPGRYALPAYLGPLLVVETTDEWELINEPQARYVAFGGGANGVGTMSRLVNILGTPSGTTGEAALATVRSIDTLLFDGEVATATVGPFEATIVDAVAKPNPENPGDPAADIAAGTVTLDPLEAWVTKGFALTTSSPEARLRFVIVETGSRVLVVLHEAPSAEAEAFFSRADALLATLAPERR